MANKRIKISELPKIGYNQTGDLSMTKDDYLPIAVTNKLDLTVKNSMAVTTRELQRFVLQQSQDLGNETNTLTIGRAGGSETGENSFTVKMFRVEVATKLHVKGDCVFDGNVNMASITLDTGNFLSDISVGSSIYPSILRNTARTAVIPYGLLVADSTGKLRGNGTSFRSLISQAPATISAHAGRIVTVGDNGHLTFSFKVDSLLQSANSVTTSEDQFGNVLTVGTNGGINPNSGVTLAQLSDAVSNTSRTLNPTTVTTSVNHKFITSSDGSPAVSNMEYHNSSDLNVKTVADTVAAAQGPFSNSTNGGKFLVTRSSSPGLTDIEAAEENYGKFVNSVNPGNDSSDFDDSGTRGKYRTIFNSPVVLGYKHEDEVDLTDSTFDYSSQFKKGPRNFSANIGEIRWNMYNGVPTLYLAVSKMGSEVTGSKVSGACHWYGVPLFGTIDLETRPLTGSYSNLD